MMTEHRLVKSREDRFNEKKAKFAQKILWSALSVVGIIILMIACFLICTNHGESVKKKETDKTVINALKIGLTNPSSLKVLEISSPDSVFVNRMCPEYELMEMSEKFLEYSLNMMQESQEGFLEGNNNKAFRCKMDRYSVSSNTLNTLNNMLEKPQGSHSGWRVKVKYQTRDDSDTPYVAETWFIFDKDKKHILNHFDIALL